MRVRSASGPFVVEGDTIIASAGKAHIYGADTGCRQDVEPAAQSPRSVTSCKAKHPPTGVANTCDKPHARQGMMNTWYVRRQALRKAGKGESEPIPHGPPPIKLPWREAAEPCLRPRGGAAGTQAPGLAGAQGKGVLSEATELLSLIGCDLSHTNCTPRKPVV